MGTLSFICVVYIDAMPATVRSAGTYCMFLTYSAWFSREFSVTNIAPALAPASSEIHIHSLRDRVDRAGCGWAHYTLR